MKPKSAKLLLILSFLSVIALLPTHAQCTYLYGMTNLGGSAGYGTIFRTDSEGENLETVYSFHDRLGHDPSILFRGGNDKIYGMTKTGGRADGGVLFEWNPENDSIIVKFDFADSINGVDPSGKLFQATNGRYYGLTNVGGVYNRGVIYECDSGLESYTKIFDFPGGEQGSYPSGSLIEWEDGKLYGVAASGGINNSGVLFELIPSDHAYSVVYSLPESEKKPTGPLVIGDNGKFYGLHGGSLYEFDPISKVYKELSVCCWRCLIKGDNGRLYGVVVDEYIRYDYSGAYGKLYEYDIEYNSNTLLISLGADHTFHPELVKSASGTLYGMTFYMEDGYGMAHLFEYDPETYTYEVKWKLFAKYFYMYPGSLVQAKDGKWYGTAIDDYSPLFEYDPVLEDLNTRTHFGTPYRGGNPRGSLFQADDGILYGSASGLFSFDPATMNCTHNRSFSSGIGLVQAANGKLYGLSGNSILEWDLINDSIATKSPFEGINGNNAIGTLTEAVNGKLYGMTSSGGATEDGVLFEWDPDAETYTKKFDFKEIESGETPIGSLLQANNGKLYGMTSLGGVFDKGVLFEWDPSTDAFLKKVDFDGIGNGGDPRGSLVQARNGKLYGMTRTGGKLNLGALFEWDIENDSLTKKYDFQVQDGFFPHGSLLQASNGKLYGMTSRGGKYDDGVLFEWDFETDTYTRKTDFKESLNGANPYGNLIEIPMTPTLTQINVVSCADYLSPSGRYIWTESGSYSDTLSSFQGCDSIISVSLIRHVVDTTVIQAGNTLLAAANQASYQWVDCEAGYTAIEGEIGRSYNAVDNGSYALIVTQNGCADTSSCHRVNIAVGTSEIKNRTISIYPNPSFGNYTLDMGRVVANVDIKISAIEGTVLRTIQEKDIRFIPLVIDAAPGIYIVTINSESEKRILKVINNLP